MKKLLFIYNPKAGKARIKYHLADIIDEFVRAGYEVTVSPTMACGDAEVMASHVRDEYDMVVVSGGDGTLDEVVTGLMLSQKKMPLGYIPTGSTNDFGTSLNLPKSMTEAAQVAVRGRDFVCDVGKFNDGYFVYVAAFGLFTQVTYETPQKDKNILGYAAYVLEGAKRLNDIKTYNMKITHDGVTQEGEYLVGMVSNSNTVGGMKALTGNHVALDDGLFEVLLVKKPPYFIDVNGIIAALMDRNIDNPYVESFHTESITFECDSQVAWNLDGEFGGNASKAKIGIVHNGLTIRTSA